MFEALEALRIDEMHPRLDFVARVEEARKGKGEDRIATFNSRDGIVFIVADGAGGVAGGAAAAETICRALESAHVMPVDWSGWLARVDREMALGYSGLAAAVVVEVREDGIVSGASVGDCEAWVFGEGDPRNLTENQIRKPLLGEGHSEAVSFSTRISGGTLVIATDGLWKYTDRARVAQAVSKRPLEGLAADLVESVKLRSGALQDDVGVLVCEVRPR